MNNTLPSTSAPPPPPLESRRILLADIQKDVAATSLHPFPPQPDAPRRALTVVESPRKLHKKKPFSLDLPNFAHQEKLAVRTPADLPKSPSVPTFHTPQTPNQELAAPLSENLIESQSATRLVRARSNASASEVRSPPQRKPPASHSSYGIETTCGPPPSFSTQRTLSQDRLWKPSAKNDRLDLAGQTSPLDAHSGDKPVEKSKNVDPPPSSSTESPTEETESSSPATAETQSIATPQLAQDSAMALHGQVVNTQDDEQYQDHTIRGLGVGAGEEDGKWSSSDERKSEDLFLNIAKTHMPTDDQTAKADRRRSRISLPYLSNVRPSPSHRRESQESLSRDQFDPSLLSPRSDIPRYPHSRASLNYRTPASSTHARDSHSNHQQSRSIPRSATLPAESVTSREGTSTIPEPKRSYSRRYSNAGPDSAARKSTYAAARTTRLLSDPNAAEQPKLNDHHTTNSTISTTAPSTVWDELDDLKSRIRKLELTGKLPPSSAAAMSSAERPRTATTTVTTMSSSPKYGKSIASPIHSAIEGVPSTVHPLLHEALGKAKLSVSNDVFQKLQATATDALQLTSMLGGGVHSARASEIGGPLASERQLRRRADSMCRGLTELTIALSADTKPLPSPPYPPANRRLSSSHSNFVSRRHSNEPLENPPVSSRVQSRLETRRASLLPGSARLSFLPSETVAQTPPSGLTQPQSTSSSRIGRTSTLRNRRAQGLLDGTTDDEEVVDSSPMARPVSRALTDSGRPYRVSPRDRTTFSREYTRQHPLPTQLEGAATSYKSSLPTHVGSKLTPRRQYTSSRSVASGGDKEDSPNTPSETFGRITVVGQEQLGTGAATPDSVTLSRGGGTSRRSMGLASRIGSSVGSRLRAVRAERGVHGKDPQQQQQSQQPQQPKSLLAKEMAQLQQDSENLRKRESAKQGITTAYDE